MPSGLFEVRVGSQNQNTADGTNARMQCTLELVVTPSESIGRDACCSSLVIYAEQKLGL